MVIALIVIVERKSRGLVLGLGLDSDPGLDLDLRVSVEVMEVGRALGSKGGMAVNKSHKKHYCTWLCVFWRLFLYALCAGMDCGSV